MSTDTEKNIVVLGGGGAGIQVVRELCSRLPSKHHVILISNCSRYRHTPAFLRLVVKHDPKSNAPTDKLADEQYDNVFIPLDTFVRKRKKQLTLKIGKAERIEARGDGSGTVVISPESTRREERVNFHYLVCATGHNWEGPLARLQGPMQEIKFSIARWMVRFRDNKHIVLIGGGAVALGMSLLPRYIILPVMISSPELAGELLDQFERVR